MSCSMILPQVVVTASPATAVSPDSEFSFWQQVVLSMLPDILVVVLVYGWLFVDFVTSKLKNARDAAASTSTELPTELEGLPPTDIIEAKLDGLHATLQEAPNAPMDAPKSELPTAMEASFDRLGAKMDGLPTDMTEAKLDGLHATLQEAPNAPMDASKSELPTAMEASFDRLNAKMDALDAKIDVLIATIAVRMDQHENRVQNRLDAIQIVLEKKYPN
jgi:hypothetical protein